MVTVSILYGNCSSQHRDEDIIMNNLYLTQCFYDVHL